MWRLIWLESLSLNSPVVCGWPRVYLYGHCTCFFTLKNESLIFLRKGQIGEKWGVQQKVKTNHRWTDKKNQNGPLFNLTIVLVGLHLCQIKELKVEKALGERTCDTIIWSHDVRIVSKECILTELCIQVFYSKNG